MAGPKLRRITAWLTVPTAGMLLTLGLVVPAKAATVGPVYICDPGNTSYCWIEHTDTPFYMFLEKNQDLKPSAINEMQDTALCGGTVTSTCPFSDQTLDLKLVGHEIIWFINFAGFMASNSNGEFDATQTVTGSNVAYVPVSSGSVFISVGASNYEHTNFGANFPSDDMEICPDNDINEQLIWESQAICGNSQSWTIKAAL